MPPADILVRLRGITKDYRSLRPLRIAELDVTRGRSLALVGFDQMMAEVFVDLITGAILPDSGEIVVFGQPTSAIPDPAGWLVTLRICRVRRSSSQISALPLRDDTNASVVPSGESSA